MCVYGYNRIIDTHMTTCKGINNSTKSRCTFLVRTPGRDYCRFHDPLRTRNADPEIYQYTDIDRIFNEALYHTRRKALLSTILPLIRKNLLEGYYRDMTFEGVMKDVYTNHTQGVRGLGVLVMYDISAAIFRFQGRDVDRVYIIGGGPLLAKKKLSLPLTPHRVSRGLVVRYTDIPTTINALVEKGVVLDERIRNTRNGDVLESYLCNWQRSVS